MQTSRPIRLEKAVIDMRAFPDGKAKGLLEEFSFVDIMSMNARHWVSVGSPDYGLNPERDQTIRNFCCRTSILFAESADKCRILERMIHRTVYCLQTFGYSDVDRSSEGEGDSDHHEGRSSEGGDSEIADPATRSPEEAKAVTTGGKAPRPRCLRHGGSSASRSTCSLPRALALAKWCAENPEKIDLRSVKVRKNTFADWPTDCPSAETMALNGFVSIRDDTTDRTLTVCVYCDVKMHKWHTDDDVFTDHRRCAPDCPIVCRIMKEGTWAHIDGLDFQRIQYD